MRFARRAVVAMLVVLFCAGAARMPAAGVLLDQFGNQVPASELSGHYLLVYFGYTSCPDICPSTLTVISAVLKQLGPKGSGLRVYFVTVDPARDTTAVLRDYLGHFDPRITGLTGSPGDLAAAARKFGVAVQPGATGGNVGHGVFIYFVGPDGRVLQAFHPRSSAELILESIRAAMAAPHGGAAS